MKFKSFIFLFIIFVGLYSNYKVPSKNILEVFNAEPMTYMKTLNNSELAIRYKYLSYQSLEKLSIDYLSLAGKKINPFLCSEKKDYPYVNLFCYNTKTKKEFSLSDKDDKYIYEFKVSPNNKYIAYLTEVKGGLILKVKELKTGKIVYKSDFYINNVIDYLAFNWNKDNKSLTVASIPDSRGKMPVKDIKDTSPIIKESVGKVAKARTFQDLLKNDFDIKLFDYFFTSQMLKIDILKNKKEKLYKPGIFRVFIYSPDAKYILVKEVLKPYSFSFPYYRFPYETIVLNREGKKIKQIVKKPLQNEIPLWGTEVGVRYAFFASNADATLIWAEAQDGGDPLKKSEYRDFLYSMDLNKDAKPKLFLKLKERFAGIEFFKEKGLCVVSQNDYEKEWIKSYIVSFTDKDYKKREIESRSQNDKYKNPGKFVTSVADNGEEYILQNGNFVYKSGLGATKDGYFPFLDKIDIKTWKKTRLFQSSKKDLSRFIRFYNGDFNKLIILTQNKTTPPNYFIHNLKNGKKTKISDNKDNMPLLRKIKKEIVTYKRKDGLLLSGTLYYPLSYKKGKKYPLLIIAYPREYKDAKTASQVSGTDNTFTRLWGCSATYMTLSGYMVLKNAAMPVVGDVIKRNDTFVEQIVSSAKAAIDYLDDKNLVDRNKVAVMGHSYGAFMTANLLAHSNLFKAGIARSGAYNRTLTPFGFQSERRTFWEAKDFYLKVSPFAFADKIKTPLLLVHGENDPNTGTFPMQSERLFDAIKGNGGIVRLCLLPYEGHGYYSRESNLHVLYEMENWLNKYLKSDK